MRDHPNHGTTPMMAGMWGVKVGAPLNSSYEYKNTVFFLKVDLMN